MREEIVEALAEVASALDRRDWEALGASFTDDAEGYSASGRDAIVAVVRAHLGGCGPSQHLLGNHRIEIDGDTARSLTYGRVHHVAADGDAVYECFGEYDDRWVRSPGGWRLTRRVFTVSYELGDRAVLQPG